MYPYDSLPAVVSDKIEEQLGEARGPREHGPVSRGVASAEVQVLQLRPRSSPSLKLAVMATR